MCVYLPALNLSITDDYVAQPLQQKTLCLLYMHGLIVLYRWKTRPLIIYADTALPCTKVL